MNRNQDQHGLRSVWGAGPATAGRHNGPLGLIRGAVSSGALLGFLGGLGLWAAGAPALAAPCAAVELEIPRGEVVERQAFELQMRIRNDQAHAGLSNIAVQLKFCDADGQPVAVGPDAGLPDAIFQVRLGETKNIHDLGGAGSVGPSRTAVVRWWVTPAIGAGGSREAGLLYYAGGSLSYESEGEPWLVEINPVAVAVKPIARFEVDYFIPAQIFGADAATARVEAPVPFHLGVRVRNVGYGSAQGVRMETVQSRFETSASDRTMAYGIQASEVNGGPASGGFAVSLGDIGPGRAGLARWVLECPWSGAVAAFSANYSQADGANGRQVVAVDEVRTHALVWPVQVDLPGRDGVRDFLAGGGAELKAYESEGLDTAVANVSSGATWQLAQSGSGERAYVLTVPAASAPFYAQVSVPEAAGMEVRRVVRSDGKTLPAANAWLSKSRAGGAESWSHSFNLFDVNGGGAYRVALGRTTVSNNVPPVLAPIGRKVTREGETLEFLAEATDANDTLPALTAFGLPPGAGFQDGGEGAALFSWTPATGQYGVWPVRFVASDGELADWEIVKIYVGRPGEALNADGIPESLADWTPAIDDVLAQTAGDVADIQWESADGLLYELYYSDAPFGPGMAWSKVGATRQGDGTLLNMLDLSLGADRPRRFYRLVLAGESPDTNLVWGVIRRDLPPGYTLISPPLRMDRRFDGAFGEALGIELQGNDAGIGSGADEVYILQANGTWRMLYLDASGIWREANGEASTYELPAGRGVWVARKEGAPAQITFAGPVGNDGTQTTTLQPGFNLIGLSEGKDLPLVQALQNANPAGGPSEETADQIVIQKADGSMRRLMYVQGWGAPFDGNWFDLGTFQIVPDTEVLQPGDAYYYLRRGEETAVRF